MVGKRTHDQVHMVAEIPAQALQGGSADGNDLDMADLGASRSSNVDAADNMALDITMTPSLQAFSTANDGFSTPLGPFLLDLPSIAPTYLETMPKRMRSFSELTKQSQASLDWAADQNEASHLWDGFKESEAAALASSVALSRPHKTRPPIRKSARPHTKPLKQGKKAVSPQQAAHSGTKDKRPSGEIAVISNKKKKLANKAAVVRGSTPPTAMPGVVMGSAGLPLAYSPDMRRRKVQSYLEKRKRRVWKKEIKYSCRKQFAESRPRVAGRFVPKTALAVLQGAAAAKGDAISMEAQAALFGNDDLLLSLG